jgi:hypothetical protein
MIGAQWHRLNTQRPDQGWVNELLTDRYHAEHHRRTHDPLYGGLNGDITILIGLVAFSVPDEKIEWALKHCIQHVDGKDGGWKTHGLPRHEGCKFLTLSLSLHMPMPVIFSC